MNCGAKELKTLMVNNKIKDKKQKVYMHVVKS